MIRTKRILLISVAVFAVFVAGPVASEQTAGTAWDQAAVTALAQELVAAAGDLRDSVRQQPDLQSNTVRRARRQALDDMRVVQSSVRSLSRQLENGDGQLETYPTFRRIQILRRDIARNAQRAAFGAPTPSKLETARKLLEQLEPFYAAEAAAYEAVAGE